MNKVLISISIAGVIIAGYLLFRVYNGGGGGIPLKMLKLKNIFDWVDEILPNLSTEKEAKLEINILPNLESQKLTKSDSKYVYVAVIRQTIDEKNEVLASHIFYAKSVDVDLYTLNQGNIIVIPIA